MSSLSFLSLKQVLTSGAKDTLMTRSVRSGTVPVLVRLSCDEYPRLDLLACNEIKYYKTNTLLLKRSLPASLLLWLHATLGFPAHFGLTGFCSLSSLGDSTFSVFPLASYFVSRSYNTHMVGLEYLDFDIISSTRVYYICNMSNVVNQNLLDRDPAKPVEDTGEKGDEENHLERLFSW